VIPPGLESVLRIAAERRERRGAFGDARFTVADLTPAQADALDGLPWPGRRPKPFLVGETRTLTLARLEAALEAAGLRHADLYPQALGRPLKDLPRERADRRAAREAFWDDVLAHPVVAGHRATETWFQRARDIGQVGPGDRELVADALRVVEWVGAHAAASTTAIDRAVLAARLFDGRPHALDAGTPLERLARQLLATTLGSPPEMPRAAWTAAGVEVDPTSTSVLTLCLLAQGDTPVEIALRALHGTHVVLTLAQLELQQATWGQRDVFVCENPSILRAAERALGPRCPPLVCGAGWPTDAVRALLGQLAASGATLRYHGDFDPEGVAIFRLLQREIEAVPWRYDAEAYRTALAENADRELPTAPIASERSDPLAQAIAAEGRAVPEELLVDRLLTDLAG
jgi:uncharacterized protein (TIGR02679 family)